MKRLIESAIKYNEIHCISHVMNHFLGEYLEGYVDRARDLFNEYWEELNNSQKQAVIDDCVFERVANSLAEKSGLEKPFKNTTDEYHWERIRKEFTL